jgi:hypothetical protein
MAIDIEMRKAGFGFTLLYFLNTCAKDPIFAEENIGLDLLTILLWGGLRWEDKGMTLDRTGEIINKYLEDVGDFGELTMLIMKALMESNIFKVKKADEGNVTAEAAN